MDKGAVLTVGFLLLGGIAAVTLVEIFGGPVKPTKNNFTSGPGYVPGATSYGSVGTQVAKTATQAANTANVVTGDIVDVAQDAATLSSLANTMFGGGGSSNDDENS